MLSLLPLHDECLSLGMPECLQERPHIVVVSDLVIQHPDGRLEARHEDEHAVLPHFSPCDGRLGCYLQECSFEFKGMMLQGGVGVYRAGW